MKIPVTIECVPSETLAAVMFLFNSMANIYLF